MSMDIKEIMDIIPHRQPFLLIDRVEEIVEENLLRQLKMFPIMNRFLPDIFHRNRLCRECLL